MPFILQCALELARKPGKGLAGIARIHACIASAFAPFVRIAHRYAHFLQARPGGVSPPGRRSTNVA